MVDDRSVHIFGDSYSTNFSSNNSVRYESSWPMLLSGEHNVNLASKAGASNLEIIRSVMTEFGSIRRGDAVILQIGYFNRVFDMFTDRTFTAAGMETFTSIERSYYISKLYEPDLYVKNTLMFFDHIITVLRDRTDRVFVWMFEKIGERNSLAMEYFNDSIIKKHGSRFITFDGSYSAEIGYFDKHPEYCVGSFDKHLNELGHANFYNVINKKIHDDVKG